MKLDFSAIHAFLSHLVGKMALQAALEHSAYQTVFLHASYFGRGLSESDVRLALEGQPSSFYGLKDLDTNLEQIKALLQTIESHQEEWLDLVHSALRRILPREDLTEIVIYPILGYDMGIGIQSAVCMNLNVPLYLSHPQEFLYFMIHECTHVIYERSHRIPSIRELTTPQDVLEFYATMVQNEGFAVYAPFRLRLERQHLTHSDYQTLTNPAEMRRHIGAFLDTYNSLQTEQTSSVETLLERLFDSQRLPYRVGAEILRRLEQQDGLEVLTSAFYLDGPTFIQTYKSLIEN